MKTKKITLLLCIFVISYSVFGMNASFINAKTCQKNNYSEEPVEQQVIAFGDSFSYQLDENTSWSITRVNENAVLKSGLGSISNFNFTELGTFNIEIVEAVNHNQGECNHPHFPKKVIVTVSPLKMKFDFSSMKYSNEILGGQSQDGNTLTIDVDFSNVNNESVEFTAGELTTAGVGTSIKGKLVNEKIILRPGINHLVYKLTGSATSQTYIMFDFNDINNQVVSYYNQTKIK